VFTPDAGGSLVVVNTGGTAAKLWARHTAIPVPTDLLDDTEIIQTNQQVGEVMRNVASSGRLSPTDEQWLRSVRPELNRRLITMRASGERGYVESLLCVVDELIASAKFG
jgi:hypothetical protein